MAHALDGKVAIVTGASRGIGRAYAEALSREGAAVLIADMLETEGEATAADIRAQGGRAVFQWVDVSDPDSTEAMAARAVAEFGGIDILVNNAAMFASVGRFHPKFTATRFHRRASDSTPRRRRCLAARSLSS